MCVDYASEDDGGVGEVKSGRCDVKDDDDCKGAADADEVECDREEQYETDGVDGCLGVRIDFLPEP